jgi:hypothetical protein
MLRFCRTYIFTFDSLGGRHPQAINKLSAYLKLEANDKKKVENTGNIGSKSVPVGSQSFFQIHLFFLKAFFRYQRNPISVTVAYTCFTLLRLS